MPVAIKSTGGGSVTLTAPSTASDLTLTLPSATGTVATTTGTLTNPTINGFTGDTSVINVGSGQFYKDTSGNVGIGVTPSAWPGQSASYYVLQSGKAAFYDAGGSQGRMSYNAYISSVGTNTYISTAAATRYDQNAGQHIWSYAASGTAGTAITFTEAMRIDSSGNVGIGTSSPSEKLSVYSAIGIRGSNFASTTYVGSSVNTTGVYTGLDSGGNFAINVRDAGALTFSTTNAERARIDSSGSLLVGTPSSNSGKITVLTSGGASMSCAQTGTTGDMIYFRTSINTLAGYITCPTSTTTNYVSVSDYRLKHSVMPMTSGLATVAALKPVTYKWKTDEADGEGFIAHELQEVIPLAVTGEKDAVRKDGSIKPQGVDYSKIVVHLVAAIQELKADLDAAKAEIATLKGAA